MMSQTFRVDLIEYERGWGSRIDDRLFFDDWDAAVKYVEKFNSENTDAVVPDWYMIADGPYRVETADSVG